MAMLAWVALGGALGSGLRYGVNLWSGRALGDAFPWATLVVNVTGCLAMGLLVGFIAFKITLAPEIRAFLATGLLGGFTTFSAFSLDFAELVERKSYGLAISYGAASVALSIAAVFAGLAIARAAHS